MPPNKKEKVDGGELWRRGRRNAGVPNYELLFRGDDEI